MRERIEAQGTWSVPLFDYEPEWNVNYSSILTQLIQYAGRFCENYASDLFIIWKYCVDNKLKDRNLESYSIRFGFRENGVDHELSNDPDRQPVTENKKNYYYYYRKVCQLDITIDDSKIKMEL